MFLAVGAEVSAVQSCNWWGNWMSLMVWYQNCSLNIKSMEDNSLASFLNILEE